MTRTFVFRTTLCCLLFAVCGCTAQKHDSNVPHACAWHKQIVVDGDPSDWTDVPANRAQGRNMLWLDNEELKPQGWQGNSDLSFAWKAAWSGDKLYFLFDVTDDAFQQCKREFSWLNDCIEIQFDPRNLEGERLEGVAVETPLEDRLGATLHGYELHFLPCSPPRVYLDDTKTIYRTENQQTAMFYNDWNGEIQYRRTATGYLVEIGFTVPNLTLEPGMIMGVEIAVGDDDGNSRESLMVWTGYKGPFWITMDHYGKMKLAQ